MRRIKVGGKGVAFTSDKSETPLQAPDAGRVVWFREMFRRKLRKEPVHG